MTTGGGWPTTAGATPYYATEDRPHVAVVDTDPVAPDEEPLTAAELIERARVGPGDEEATLADVYIRAARQFVERDTSRTLRQRALELRYDAIASPILVVPRPPLIAVTAFTWWDAAGDEQTVPATAYRVDTASEPGRIGLVEGGWFASTLHPFQPWVLTVTAGWTKATLPETLRQAVALLAGYWLTTGRDLAAMGTQAEELPYGYEAAVAPYRLVVLV